MLTRMADSPNSNPPATAPAEESGVLAALPRTRPQRASARRAAARAARPSGATAATRAPDAPDAAHSAHAAEPIKASTARRTGGRRKAAAKPAATPASRPASRRRAPSVCTPANERAPRQGFEAEPEAGNPAVAVVGRRYRQKSLLTLRRVKHSEGGRRCLFNIAHFEPAQQRTHCITFVAIRSMLFSDSERLHLQREIFTMICTVRCKSLCPQANHCTSP